MLVVALLAPGTAAAAIHDVFKGQTISGSAIPCAAQTDGVRVCHGADGGVGGTDLRLKSFDGQPLEVYVTLPPSSAGPDGNYPLIVESHGWGNSAGGPNNDEYYSLTPDQWAKQGYAVLQLTARGFGDSCGSAMSRAVDPAASCTNGYIRLDDDRYEVRDVQYAIGLLADAGIVNPAQIGVTGESYGGGVSLALATLKDRVMNADGTLHPWTSPHGTPLSIAAAAPVIPWSDLASALLPNGRALDYEVTSPMADLSPIGVEKQSFVSGLYALGQASGYFAPAGMNSQADITSWFALINAGEPYDQNPELQSVARQVTQFHSSYYLLDGAYGTAREAPAPLLIANGFTDDLFPVDEAVRYYNLERSLYPSAPISLFDFDGGHQRGQNKKADTAVLGSLIEAFFDHYVKQDPSSAAPRLGVTALTETCPGTAPAGGPYTAATWAALHPGQVDYSAPAKQAQTISSSAGDPTISKAIDPVAGGGACATVPATDQGSGVATYRLPAVTGSGYTLLGSPTVIANLSVTGTFAYVAERLWDVDPKTNTETLVARGVYRIDSSKPDGLQVFQLHPGAWHFAAGHIPKLELLGQDVPYLRKSNGTFSISVSNLQLRLPVHERPGTPGVTTPKPPVTPKPHPAQGCPRASGKLRGRRLGLVHLGMSRAQARGAYKHSSNRGKRYEDFLCLTPIGIRVGYASPRLLKALPRAKRKRLVGRVVWVSTANQFYSLHGVRAGDTLRAARHHLKLARPFHIGLNYWYLAPGRVATGVLKVRRGIVEEIGMGDNTVTQGRKTQIVFLHSFS